VSPKYPPALLLGLCLTSGCDVVAPYEYETSCFLFQSATPMRPDSDLRVLSGYVETLFQERLGVDLCARLDRIRVRSHDGEGNMLGTSITGFTQPLTHDIDVTWHMRSLAHEVLHVWDFVHLAYGSAWHEGWDSNGYNALDAEYKKKRLAMNEGGVSLQRQGLSQ
jgi:hypothetical protein